MSSKEASTPSLDRRHAATRETVPQPRHVARLVFSTTAAFDSFHSFIPIPPLPLGHGFGGILALQLRIFYFSVSSQKLFATTAKTICAPPEMQTLALGTDPFSLSSAP